MFLNAKKHFYLLLILCIILLVLPLAIRAIFNNSFLLGEESYTNLRTAQYIKINNELPTEDDYSYGGRPYTNEYGMPLLLAFNPALLSRIIPLIFGILSFILFYFIIEEIYPFVKGLASLFLIISPSFIYLFSTATKYSGALLFTLFGIYLLVKDKKYYGLISFIIVGFFSYLISLSFLIAFLIYGIYKNKWKEFYVLLIGNIIVFFIQFSRAIKLGFPETFFGFAEKNFNAILQILFSDFGSKAGFSIFLLFLALIGIFAVWHENYRYTLYYVILALSFILSLYFSFLIYFIALFLAVFAAHGFVYLHTKEWKSDTFRYWTLLVFSCGLLFSTVAYINNIDDFIPTENFGEGLQFLRDQNIETTIFSHYTRSEYLSYGGMKTFIDDNFLYAPNAKGRWEDSNRLLKSEDINNVIAIMNRYNIQYIWVDEQMIDEVWRGDEIELLFLLRYSPNVFENVFDNGDVQIYKLRSQDA